MAFKTLRPSTFKTFACWLLYVWCYGPPAGWPLPLASLGVGFEKIFDSKFENFSVFRIFLHLKIVLNSNRIFLDVRRAYVESRTFHYGAFDADFVAVAVSQQPCDFLRLHTYVFPYVYDFLAVQFYPSTYSPVLAPLCFHTFIFFLSLVMSWFRTHAIAMMNKQLDKSEVACLDTRWINNSHCLLYQFYAHHQSMLSSVPIHL
jgi:hypothetical protein